MADGFFRPGSGMLAGYTLSYGTYSGFVQKVSLVDGSGVAISAGPAPGTAGTPSADVLTVQGITGGTPLIVGGGIASGAADSGNPVKFGGVYSSTKPTYTNGQRGDAQIGSRGALMVQLMAADSTGTPAVTTGSADAFSGGTQGLVTYTFNGLFNGTTWDRQKKPNATSRLLSSAATTNATSAKGSAGDLHKLVMRNTTGAILYFKAYNKATAPTVGTDTPVMTLEIPANGLLDLSFPNGGYYFSLGIGYALTTGQGDADTGAVDAAAVTGLHLFYS